jgi:hypothetical protein
MFGGGIVTLLKFKTMSEEQYKKQKGFLTDELIGDQLIYSPKEAGNHIRLSKLLSKFKTYLIEHDPVNEILTGCKNDRSRLKHRIKELEKEVQQHRDNAFLVNYNSAISDGVKVVSDEEIKSWAYGELFSDSYVAGRIEGAKWMRIKLTWEL